ncbi:hypothetical protein B0H11DRAFT_1898939 [Mycena galericulata]|nr:hypothetical protein B0H11DRAFT_1898939 [Mycena galericulata]
MEGRSKEGGICSPLFGVIMTWMILPRGLNCTAGTHGDKAGGREKRSQWRRAQMITGKSPAPAKPPGRPFPRPRPQVSFPRQLPTAMGRRKIEIQPITRKNGLFKKAYELGVLCSVDVAVIIFEERPGHHHKLYQYCSGDIRDIVARHVQYDGERDTKGPKDFSGAGVKTEDAGDGDDDDADEEEVVPSPRAPAKRTKSKINEDDMDYRSMAIPSPPISIRNLPNATSNAIPTSSDRHSARTGNGNGNGMHPPSKKQRISSSHGRASSDEDAALTLPPPTSGGYNFPPVPYRGGGGGYGIPPPQAPPFFPPLFDPPPPAFRAQYDPGMYHQLMRQQQRAAQQSQAHASPFSVDWPVHSGSGGGGGGGAHHNNGPGTQVSPTQAQDGGGGGGGWLDFLSGPPPVLPPGRGAGSTSWERGGGGSSGGGGGGGKRAKSSSRSGSEGGRTDDKDG